MDPRKLNLVLNQRLNDVWSVEGVTIDAAVLSGAVEEWDSLALAVKINLMCSLLGLRNKGALEEGLLSVTRVAMADKDEWVRVMGQMLEPLLREPPQRVALSDPVFASTVRQITAMLHERGQPAWRPAFQSYLETQEPDEPLPNPHFVVPFGHGLVPLKPHPDPESLMPSAPPAVQPVPANVRLSRPSAVPAERKMGTGLRGTSTLLDKKPYQQKKTVKALTAEQVAELSRRESHSEAKRQAHMAVTPHQLAAQQAAQAAQAQSAAVQAQAQAQANAQAAGLVEDLQEQERPQKALKRDVMDDLLGLTSVTQAVQPVSIPSTSKDAEVADGLMGLFNFNPVASVAMPAPVVVAMPVVAAAPAPARPQFDLSTATAPMSAEDRELVGRVLRGEQIGDFDPNPGLSSTKTIVLRDDGSTQVVMDVNFGTEQGAIRTVKKQQ
jgi:hypothetical protein